MTARTNEAEAYDYIINLIYDRCRVRLHEGKQQLIKARLGKRVRLHGFESLGDYCAFLRSQADEEELTHVVDALTTNFTHFLREEDHFKFLVEKALPTVLQAGRKRFEIWSAACASGEEPYSIAFYLHEHYPPLAGWDWRIRATDISTKALNKAQQGIYAADRLEALPCEWLPRYFQRGQGQWLGHYRVKPALAARVQFQHLNLLSTYGFTETYAVIFCRNVMIYFDRPTQQQLVKQLVTHLDPGGFLLVGHSESLTGLSVPIRCLRPSIYQRL
jgi:chemotaxis protein methyltransferase CheR